MGGCRGDRRFDPVLYCRRLFREHRLFISSAISTNGREHNQARPIKFGWSIIGRSWAARFMEQERNELRDDTLMIQGLGGFRYLWD